MVQKTSSQGQTVVDAGRGFLDSFMAMPRHYSLVVMLWIINTYLFKNFDATPYLCVSAVTKQSGKTSLIELVGMLAKNSKIFTDATAASCYGLLEAFDSWVTFLFDESESMSTEGARTMRNFMNSGYRAGQTIPRRVPGSTVPIEFPVYCPKGFALIGDVYDTLRDRSIVLWLARGIPARKYKRTVALGEAIAVRLAIEKLVEGLKGQPMADFEADWLEGRDEEIWSPLLSIAKTLHLNDDTMNELIKASAVLTMGKTAEARKYTTLKGAETAALNDSYSEKAIRDLAAVFKDGEDRIMSTVAVERMKGIITSGWEAFRGQGLTENALADLIRVHGVHVGAIQFGKQDKRKGTKRVVAKGYYRKDVFASVPSKRSE